MFLKRYYFKVWKGNFFCHIHGHAKSVQVYKTRTIYLKKVCRLKAEIDNPGENSLLIIDFNDVNHAIACAKKISQKGNAQNLSSEDIIEYHRQALIEMI